MDLLKKKRKNKRRKNNRFRELTNNERLLLTVLAIVIIFWLSFKYLIEPQLLKVSDLKEDKTAYNLKIEDNNRILKNKEKIIEERNELFIEKTNIEKDFFKSLSQPDILYILNELLSDSNIDMKSLRFNRPFTEELNGQEIQKMDILMPFDGDFDSLKEIILSLEKESRKLVINDISLEKSEETEIEGNINLGVYSLKGLVESDGDNLPIQITSDNAGNPFKPYEGYIDPNEVIKEDTAINENQVEDEDQNQAEDTDQTENQNQAEDGSSSEETVDGVIDTNLYDTYTAVKGDNISYISYRKYGTVKYVDEILELNGMKRESILPIGKVLKLKKR